MKSLHLRRAASLIIGVIIALSAVIPVSALTPVTRVSDVYKSSTYYTKLTSLTLTGDQRNDLVSVAMSQLGYHEGNSNADFDGMNTTGSGNFTEFNYTYGTIGDPATYGYEWCASFATWCLKQAGVSKTVFIGEISCSRWVTKLTAAGTFTSASTGYIPKTGDIIFFHTTSSNTASHVGIVRFVKDSTIYTVEGNSSNKVSTHTYAVSAENILGFGTLPYTDTSSGPLGVYSVTASSLNLRDGPSTSYDILTAIPNGTRLEVWQISSGWAQVSYGGYTGWVSMSYLTPVASTYTVTYNPNGGISYPMPQTKTYGVPLTLASPVPARPGYVFAGWATSPDGAAQYPAGGTYTNNADVTLYATWTPDSSLRVSIADCTAYIGSTAKVAVNITENRNVQHFSLTLGYDADALEYAGYTVSANFVNAGCIVTHTDSTVTVTGTLAECADVTGTLVTVELRVKSVAVSSGSLPVTLGGQAQSTSTATNTSFDGAVITPLDCITGDANGDGRMSALDLIGMRQYLAKAETAPSFNPLAADFDGNSVINARDVLRLKRALAA